MITPIRLINNHPEELFSLKIIKQWKPDFKDSFALNQSIPVKFSRTLNGFRHFDASQLRNIDCSKLNGKIVLLGYLGPSDEDKHFTPIRIVEEYPEDKPDTYGLVIIANEIRTILEYKKN